MNESLYYDSVDTALMSSFFTIYMLLILALSVFMVVCEWRIYEKAGEKGWKSLIPLYNTYTLYKIVWGNGWYMLLTFLFVIPFIGWLIGLFVVIKFSIDMAKRFGESKAFGVGLALLPHVFYAILAFGNATYQRFPNTNTMEFEKRISETTTIEEQRAKLRERLAKENEKKTPFES